ncbi:MAG: hypothetical protein ABI977_33205 [Acidobacteriota bacterium]
MPRKKTLTETESHKPLISIERIIYEKTAFKVSKGVLVNLEQYVSYIKDATGDEPTPDEIVDKGMQRLFDADRGFKQWLQKNIVNGGNERRTESLNGSAKSVGAVAAPQP